MFCVKNDLFSFYYICKFYHFWIISMNFWICFHASNNICLNSTFDNENTSRFYYFWIIFVIYIDFLAYVSFQRKQKKKTRKIKEKDEKKEEKNMRQRGGTSTKWTLLWHMENNFHVLCQVVFDFGFLKVGEGPKNTK